MLDLFKGKNPSFTTTFTAGPELIEWINPAPNIVIGMDAMTLKRLSKHREGPYSFDFTADGISVKYEHYRVKRINWKKGEVTFQKSRQNQSQ